MKKKAAIPQISVVIVPLVIAAVVAGAAPAEMPEALADALANPDEGTVVRMRWSALNAFHLLQRLAQLRGPEHRVYLGPMETILEPYFELAGSLPLDPDYVDDVWMVSRGKGHLWGSRTWISTRRTQAEIREILERAGWQAATDDPATFYQPLPPEAAALLDEQRSVMAETLEWDAEDIEEALASHAPRAMVSVLEDGWLAWGTTAMEAAPEGSGGALVAIDDELPFPASELLDLDSPALLAMGIRIGEPDDNPDSPDSEEDDEVAELRRRITELSRRDEHLVTERLGNFFVAVSETDAGLVVDLLLRRPDGGDMGFAAELVGMALLILRVEVLAHPDLERELACASISHGHGQVRVELFLSLAALHQTLEDEVSRQTELAELRQRLADLVERRAGP